MEFEKVVRRRRMVRNYQKGTQVPEEDVKKIMELAQHYPSAGFSQGVAFVVIKDPETKRKIGGEREIWENGRVNFISIAPLLIVVCVSESIYHRRYREADKLQADGTEIEWPTPYWFFDAGAASLIILYSAVDLGYAAAFVGLPHDEIRQVRQLLGIPDEFHPVGMIAVGKPAPDVKSPSLKRGRRPYADVIHFEHW
jgi:nitroreductase